MPGQSFGSLAASRRFRHGGLIPVRTSPRLRIAAACVLSSIAVLVLTAPAQAARTDCAPEPGWPGQNADLAAQVVVLVNQHRATLGLPALSVSQTLTDAAAWKAAQLAAD